jgi:hypothetical protein
MFSMRPILERLDPDSDRIDLLVDLAGSPRPRRARDLDDAPLSTDTRGFK